MGILLVDKPKGITSHDVINRLRKITGIKKIGHAGTLDPNASGLLVVAIGREHTKKLGDLSLNTKKQYIAEITLGEERTTHDIEGEVVNENHSFEPKISDIEKVLEEFRGEINQVPPIFSALKINGKKAYQLARKGIEIDLEPRKIFIYSCDLLDYAYPILKLDIQCSSGTYIRSLARDIGRSLGSYAYLSDLRRTTIGGFSIENAHQLDSIEGDNWKGMEI